MVKRTKMAIEKKNCDIKNVEKLLRIYGIVYVVENNKYIGCIANSEIRNGKVFINRNSVSLRSGNNEKQMAKEIFEKNKLIKNIPILDAGGHLLYEYVKEISDYDFYSSTYWESRYKNGGNSGTGSYNRLAEFKAEIINGFIKDNNIESMIEWGCGDGNQLGLFCPIPYIGYDVSETAIDICNHKYSNDLNKKFFWYDGGVLDVRKMDMAISLDVIFHLIEEENYRNYMKNLFFSAERYVCIYSSDFEEERIALHEQARKFTPYVEEYFPEWKLKMVVKNKYPYCINDSTNTSLSDFYFYAKGKI